MVDVEPGGAGCVRGTVAARLAKPVPQCRGGAARAFRRGTAGEAARRGVQRPRAGGTPAVRRLSRCDRHMGGGARAPLGQAAGGLLQRGVWLSRDAANRGRRAGDVGRRPRQVSQRPWPGICRDQSVLPGGLFSAGDQRRRVADGILQPTRSAKPPARTGAGRRRSAAGLRSGGCRRAGVIPCLGGKRRPLSGLPARREPADEPAAFPRPHAARVRWRRLDADYAGNPARRRGRAAVAAAWRGAVGVPHERGPRRVPRAGTDARADRRRGRF